MSCSATCAWIVRSSSRSWSWRTGRRSGGAYSNRSSSEARNRRATWGTGARLADLVVGEVDVGVPVHHADDEAYHAGACLCSDHRGTRAGRCGGGSRAAGRSPARRWWGRGTGSRTASARRCRPAVATRRRRPDRVSVPTRARSRRAHPVELGGRGVALTRTSGAPAATNSPNGGNQMQDAVGLAGGLDQPVELDVAEHPRGGRRRSPPRPLAARSRPGYCSSSKRRVSSPTNSISADTRSERPMWLT